jgi:LysR family hydrogen peroxide-inducible transcriptional activator
LRQLQFLVALDAHGSFVAAAEAVGVTQPTLSAGIKELEAVLGETLVERGRAGAVLTPAGEEAVTRAQRAMSEVEGLVRAVHDAGEPFSGAFRLGAIPTIAPFILPKALPLLKRKFPKLRLQMREDLTARLVDGLRARTLDAALIALPYEAQGVATAPIAEDEFLFLCPTDHALAKRNDLAPEQIDRDEMLLLEDGHCLREHALSACKVAPGRRSAEVGATSLHTLVQMVAGGMGVTLLPKIAAEGGAAGGADVAMLPFAKPMIGRSIGVAWREGSQREHEARILGEVLRDLFPTPVRG